VIFSVHDAILVRLDNPSIDAADATTATS